MKAKDYAKRYADEGKTPEALFRVWKDIALEFEALMKQRNATSDAATIAVIRELDQKWKAFARIADDEIRPDGFMNIIKKEMPEIYKRIKL